MTYFLFEREGYVVVFVFVCVHMCVCVRAPSRAAIFEYQVSRIRGGWGRLDMDMPLFRTELRSLDLDAVQGLGAALANRREARLGWVREGGKWKFTHGALSLCAFSTSVVALRATVYSIQQERSQARSCCMRGAYESLKMGRLLFRGCSTLIILGGVGGDVALCDMAPYQASGSYVACLQGSSHLGRTSLPLGFVAYAQPNELPPKLSLIGDTRVVLCLLDREIALSSVSPPKRLHERLSAAIRVAERARSNESLKAWRHGQGAGVMKRPSRCAESLAPDPMGRVQAEQPPMKRRLLQKSAPESLSAPQAPELAAVAAPEAPVQLGAPKPANDVRSLGPPAWSPRASQ